MDDLSGLRELFRQLDTDDLTCSKLERLTSWPVHALGAESARLVCADEASFSGCPQSVSFLPSDRLAGLPGEPSLINGRSPIPRRFFDDDAHKAVMVHIPVPDGSDGLLGTLLVQVDAPKSFLKRHEPTLGVLASKAKDLLEHTVLHRKLNLCNDSRENSNELFGPDTVARLLNLVDLPMYVSAPNGRFVSANETFLRQFRYESLDEVNDDTGFFVQSGSWEQQMQRLAADEPVATLEVKVRAGDGSVRVAREHSTLIGKNTFGVLIDLTDYVEVNENLEKALSDQRTLNEKLTNTTGMLQKTQATAMKSLAKLAEFRDKETGNHLQRICSYMKLIADELYQRQPYSFIIGPNYAEDIYLSGMLHDIGKVAIPDTILLKPAALDSREWEMMKKHSQFGWSILHEADRELGEQSFLTLASRIALYHHERYDGTGYPHGLSGEDIPLSARIAAVADVYDALTSDRPYKSAWSHRSALREIESERGRHFDPVIVDIALEIQDKFLGVQTESADQPELQN